MMIQHHQTREEMRKNYLHNVEQLKLPILEHNTLKNKDIILQQLPEEAQQNHTDHDLL